MDGSVEKLTMRKIYLRLLPFAILGYFLAYIDRINVSFAGLTIEPGTGLRKCSSTPPWQRSHEIASCANTGEL